MLFIEKEINGYQIINIEVTSIVTHFQNALLQEKIYNQRYYCEDTNLE